MKTYTCSVCGDSYEEEIKAIGHSIAYVDKVEPTTTDYGVEAHWFCSECKKYYADEAAENEVAYEDLLINPVTVSLEITKQPEDVFVRDGNEVFFSIEANGEGLTYQWYIKRTNETAFTPWKDRTSATASFWCNPGHNGMQVYCVVTDQAGNSVVSDTANLSVLTITAQVGDLALVIGNKVELFVDAIGEGLTYQWYIKRPNETTFSPWNNRTSASTGFVCQITNNNMQFYCVITDAAGNTVKTNIVTLKVRYFEDVLESAYYFDAVNWAVERGITTGDTPTTFQPNGGCARWHMVLFLWRAAGCPKPAEMDNPFVDVQENEQYYEAALWAYQKGITIVSDLRPAKTLTRWQTVLFLWRAMGCPEPERTENPFVDIAETEEYYKAALWAYENGITTEETFLPADTCTRAQIVAFLYRTIYENGWEIPG